MRSMMSTSCIKVTGTMLTIMLIYVDAISEIERFWLSTIRILLKRRLQQKSCNFAFYFLKSLRSRTYIHF